VVRSQQFGVRLFFATDYGPLTTDYLGVVNGPIVTGTPGVAGVGGAQGVGFMGIKGGC